MGNQARRDEILYKILEASVGDLQMSLESETLNALAWLIADRILDFKIAIPINELAGEFHDKFGIFTDTIGNKLAFSGSYNDSIHGLANYESIVVFQKSNDNNEKMIELQESRFEKLWKNQDPNVKVVDLPESILTKIVEFRSAKKPYQNRFIQGKRVLRSGLIVDAFPRIPSELILRDYQEEAYLAWMQNGCKGFFEMATGTGKTITSLYCATKIFQKERRLALVIAVPYIHLADQWVQDITKFNYFPVEAYGSSAKWEKTLANKINMFKNGDNDVLCVVTTHATFISTKFFKLINQLSDNTMIIADEAHHLGTEKAKLSYPQHFEKRLALSATPSRWFDDVGTNYLLEYFDQTVFDFPLGKAIELGFLAQYYYYPEIVELTDEEVTRYYELSKKILPIFFKKNKSAKDESILEALMRQRADILKNAQNKFSALKTIIGDKFSIDHALFYSSPQQKDRILDLLVVCQS